MLRFLNDYFNIKKIIKEKREYKENMERVKALPKDYRYVYKKIQKKMWMFATSSGYDILHINYDLIELFEEGAANGKRVLEITGDDVAAFCDELLKGAKTYTNDVNKKLNSDIAKNVKKD